jgi:hypothetical protein
MKKTNEYEHIIVESFIPTKNTGFHGKVHIRPVTDQDSFLKSLHVECSKVLSNDYPVGTKFRIKAKVTQLKDGGKFIYSHYLWPYEVLK